MIWVKLMKMNMNLSELSLLCLTISMCTQRISIAIGNIFLGVALLIFFFLLYKRHKAGLPLLNSIYLSYYRIYGIFLILLLPSIFFTGQIDVSCKNFLEMWIYRFMPFVIITNLDFKDKFWQKCLLALLVYVSVDGLVALGQLAVLGQQRTLGLGDGVLRFSSIIATTIPITLVLWLDKMNFIQKKYLPICAMASLCGTLGTQSRGAWVVSAVVFLLVLLKYLNYNFKQVGGLIICVVCLVCGDGSSQSFRDRFFSIDNITTDRSNGDRIESWKSAWIMFQDKPVVGWGLNQSNKPYREKYRSKAETQGLSHFHNNYVEMAVNTGSIGLFGYLFLVLGWLWLHRDWSKGYNVAISLAWLAFHAFGMIEYNVDLSACIKTLWFVMGILACLNVNNGKDQENTLQEGQYV